MVGGTTEFEVGVKHGEHLGEILIK